uniref:BED-type domain-containing protein n=1 Tax=Meloidogyne enterolobii TaxID=390850 RepID=A0A6V7XTP6_MELEN|nr:unnamed protein product [Meloidogyne enterolobii]
MSDIWKYFNKHSTDEGKCKICSKLVKRKDGNTKGLWQHLKISHSEEFDNLKCNAASSSSSGVQESLLSFVSTKKDKRDVSEEAIARIMLRQNNSFLFFEDPDLRNLYEKAHPNLPLGSRQYFRKNVIPRMAQDIISRIKQGVDDSFYSISTDGWSQPTRSPQLQSVTIHWVGQDFQRKDMVLAAFSMTGLRHSGDVLAEKITNCLKSNGFTLEKLICCVRDDASNIKSAVDVLEKDSFQCSCHFLNLVINDTLKKVKDVNEIINKTREWTKECRKSKMKECLSRHQEEQNMPKKQLVMSCPTRWNSVFRMLNAFKEQKNAILSMQFEREQMLAGILPVAKRPRFVGNEPIPQGLPHVANQDFELLRHLCLILQIFDTETQREDNFVATSLDEIDSLSDKSDDSVTRYDIWKPKSPGNVSTISVDSQGSLVNRIQLQLATLRSFGRQATDINIFTWWREHGQQFPDLATLARMVHSIPASSVSSERLFSKAGLIFGNALRNRLSGEMVEKILVVKANMDKLLLGPPTEIDSDETDDFDDDLDDI